MYSRRPLPRNAGKAGCSVLLLTSLLAYVGFLGLMLHDKPTFNNFEHDVRKFFLPPSPNELGTAAEVNTRRRLQYDNHEDAPTSPSPCELLNEHFKKANCDCQHPVFLTNSSLQDKALTRLRRPYGIKGFQNSRDEAAFNYDMQHLESSWKYSTWDDCNKGNNKRNCSRNRTKKPTCVVVASGGNLLNQDLGGVIDSYDVVIRMNHAPATEKYASKVGRRTDIRMLQWRSASKFNIKGELLNDTLFVVALGPGAEARWMRNLLEKGSPKKFAPYKSQFRFMDPRIFAEIHRVVPSRHRPTTGILATMFAIHACSQVDIAGFSHNCPGTSLLHYFEKKTLADDKTGTGNKSLHNYGAEVETLKQFLAAGILNQDLTGNLLGADNC